MTRPGRVGAKVFIEFIKRLLQGSEEMIFLIVDGHPAHKARCVQRFIEQPQIRKRFRLFFLPPMPPNSTRTNGCGTISKTTAWGAK